MAAPGPAATGLLLAELRQIAVQKGLHGFTHCPGRAPMEHLDPHLIKPHEGVHPHTANQDSKKICITSICSFKIHLTGMLVKLFCEHIPIRSIMYRMPLLDINGVQELWLWHFESCLGRNRIGTNNPPEGNPKMVKENQRTSNLIERRSGEDRRKIYSLKYFTDGGRERRSGIERRMPAERRADCFRVSNWSSACDYDDPPDDEA